MIPNLSRILHGEKVCSAPDHVISLVRYYMEIIQVIEQADAILPRCSPALQRDYWSSELHDLKKESVDSTRLWNDCGRPRDGFVFDYEKKCLLAY